MKFEERSSYWKWESTYENMIVKEVKNAPWILRITEHSNKPIPVLVIKERRLIFEEEKDREPAKQILKDIGSLYGPEMVRCLPVVRSITSMVRNDEGIPLEIHRVFEKQKIEFRGNLPLNEEAGYKLALIFKLQERIKGLDRVELIARRVMNFTKEEAAYWYSRISDFSPEANRWAQAGLKIMLAGHSDDPYVATMIKKLRSKA